MRRLKKFLFVASSTIDNSAALQRAITLANNNQATLSDLAVVAGRNAHGNPLGESSKLMQCTDMHQLRKCPCPIWLIKSTDRKSCHRIQAAVNEQPEEETNDALEYVAPELHLIKGKAKIEVPALADKLDVGLGVMGTLGRFGISGFFMGNTAEDILEQIDCSVLAIKPPGFVSPVSLN